MQHTSEESFHRGPRRVLTCPNEACRNTRLSHTPHKDFIWCMDVTCLNSISCSNTLLHICVTCPYQRGQGYIEKKRLARHHRKFHQTNSSVSVPATEPGREVEGLIHDFNDERGSNEVDSRSEEGPAPAPYYASDAFLASLICEEDDLFAINFSFYFESKLTIPAYMGATDLKAAGEQADKNSLYFENEHLIPGSGPASIVASAKHFSSSMSSEIVPSEALFVLLNTWLVNQLGEKELTVYTALLNHAMASTAPTCISGSPSCPTPLFVPRDPVSAKKDLLHGVRSIMLNTPRPFTHTLRNGYAYISCIDSLACLLASGVKFEPLIGRSAPFLAGKEGGLLLRYNADTPRGAEIQATAESCLGVVAFTADLRIPTIIVPGFLWSDGFDPAATKQNRGSVHAFLLTFGFNQDDAHSGTTTVLLALGPSDAPTDDVELLLKQELENLMEPTGTANMFYVGKSRTVCRVFVQLFSLQEDRMERQSVTRVLGGTSNLTARWGWSADLFAQQDHLPSCKICYQGLVANQDTSSHRASFDCCANWEMEGLDFPPPPKYPLQRLPVGCSRLPFKEITFEGMQLACTEAYDEVSSGSWTLAVARIFLKTEGVNDQFSELVTAAASNRLKLNQMDPNSESYRGHLILSQAFNSTFPVDQPLRPATWGYPGVSLRDHIDVIMHLLFLGIVSTVIKETFFPWLKAHRLMTDLSLITRPQLVRLNSMSLAWCKAMPINETGTLGGAVSENYLAYCRLGKWLFGCSSILKENDLVYTDPVRTLETYTVAQIKAWYAAREIPLPNTSDNDALKARFLDDNAVEGGPPAISEKGEAGIPAADADNMINGMVALVAHVMVEGSVEQSHVWAVERHVKLFLGAYDTFDKYRRRRAARRGVVGRSNKAAWISHMNFASLLNIPGVMSRYGSLRSLWEGDRKGEGGLPPLKAKVRRGLHRNWSTAACRGVVADTALERAILSASLSVGSDSSEPSVKQLHDAADLVLGNSHTRLYKNFVTYKDEAEARRVLHSGFPVSLVILKDDRWCMVLKRGRALVVSLALQDGPTIIGGATFHKFQCGEEIDLLWNKGSEVEVFICYALLLPQFHTGVFPGQHYLITSNWEELDSDGILVRYRIFGAQYP